MIKNLAMAIMLIPAALLAGCSNELQDRRSGHQPRVELPPQRERPILEFWHDRETGQIRITTRESERGEIDFQMVALLRFDVGADAWVREWPQAPGGAHQTRLRTEALPTLNEVTGRDLPIALYYIISIVEGATERGLIYNGPVFPNDIMIGDPPEGMIATGVPGPNSAHARFVPDPEQLDWRR